jgi:diaminopimelate decarboxylase
MFHYQGRELFCDGVSLASIAEQAGTPSYVYSSESILAAYRAYDRAFDGVPHNVCYAVKANSNIAVLALLAKQGAGFDIVSGGELHRVLKAGGDPSKVVFSGVGKTREEMVFALREGIHSFNCESEAELELLNAVARESGTIARVALRVNPDVDAATHPYISTGLRDHKFGIDIASAVEVYDHARSLPNLQPESVSCHIGSQLLDPTPVLEAVDKVLSLIEALRAKGHAIHSVDLGGGLGVAYSADQQAPPIASVIARICERVRGRELAIMIEPGRSIVGPAGVLLSRVLFRKRSPSKKFVVIDAAMNDLIRPALYSAHHEILPLHETTDRSLVADVVGPVCETGDFLARDRSLPQLHAGDLIALNTAGAYGFAQSSNYNSRPRAAEVLVERDQWRLIRQRETFEDLTRGETI